MVALKNRVVILLPYFGGLPDFIRLYLRSCGWNPWIDFLFILESPPKWKVPENVKFVQMSLEALSELISAKLRLPISLQGPYKLCDFRPAYGIIFGDLIADYDYWGYGDVDLIYGTISDFVQPEIFVRKEVDVVTLRDDWLYGPTSFFRNGVRTNRLYEKSRDWQRIFSDPRHYGFDECCGGYDNRRPGDLLRPNVASSLDCMSSVVGRALYEGWLSIWASKCVKEYIGLEDYVKVTSGKIADSKGAEFLLYHYVTEKKKAYFRYPDWSFTPDEYYVTQTGFYSAESFEKRWAEDHRRRLASIPKSSLAKLVKVRRRLFRLFD